MYNQLQKSSYIFKTNNSNNNSVLYETSLSRMYGSYMDKS